MLLERLCKTLLSASWVTTKASDSSLFSHVLGYILYNSLRPKIMAGNEPHGLLEIYGIYPLL